MYRQSEKMLLLNSYIFSTCSDNMVNVGPLTAEIGWRVLGSPANFNGFHVLASLLHRRRSTEVNHTLHDVWPSPGQVHYNFGALVPYRNSARCKIYFASKSCVILYWQRYCTALEQWASAKFCERAAIPFDIGRSNCLVTGIFCEWSYVS